VIFVLDYEKIGKFLQQLRIEKGYSQEKVAQMLYVTRQVISKWERGKSIPSNNLILPICELYQVSANEIFAGEKNTLENKGKIENIAIDILKDGQKRKNKIIVYFSFIIVVLLFLFFSYYFISTYNKMKVYVFSGKSENFSIENGILMISNEQIYFDLGSFVNQNNIKFERIEIYYLKNDERKLIVREHTDKILINDYNGYNQYFNFNDMDDIVNNMYVEVTYNEFKINENIKINMEERYSNKNLFFKKIHSIGEVENPGYVEWELIIPEKIKNEFHFNSDSKEYELVKKEKNREIKITYNPEIKTFAVSETRKTEWIIWIYDFSDKNHHVMRYLTRSDGKTNSSSKIIDNKLTCISGDCSTHQKEYDYYFKTYKMKYLEDI